MLLKLIEIEQQQVYSVLQLYHSIHVLPIEIQIARSGS